MIAYFVRFFSLSYNGIKSGYSKINNSIDENAYLLGYSKFKTFSNIHLPYLKTNILLVGVLIALEIIQKVLSIISPANRFDTLSPLQLLTTALIRSFLVIYKLLRLLI